MVTKLNNHELPFSRIVKTWWPLAASWLLMGVELPLLSAVVARLADPKIHLAAYGGVVHPLSMIIESPIIMLLAASTALSRDWDSYQKLNRFMMWSGAVLTLLHILVAFTPLYYLVVVKTIGIPEEVVEPARIGLMIMTPWTWSIAYRRFNQGVLIRFGHSQNVGTGTVVRLAANAVVLGIGYLIGTIPGIIVGASAVALGVVCEALYAGYAVRPVIANQLKLAPSTGKPLHLRPFLTFYVPLAMTSLITLLANPLGSAALSRMPEALASLAVWPVVTGLVFLFRSTGMAFNEVVVALLDEPYAVRNLRRFTYLLSGAVTLLIVVLAGTPLASLWFEKVTALPPDLTEMAQRSLWLALPLPALTVFQSWFQGTMLNDRRTRGITESVAVYLLLTGLFLGFGVLWSGSAGIYVGLAAMSFASLGQTAWLWLRSRRAFANVLERDRQPVVPVVVPGSD